MAITADALRSGISEMSAFSRISIMDNEVGKASFKQSLACHFSRTEARRTNLKTINALKTAVLNDPRYSGIEREVDQIFGAYRKRGNCISRAFT